MDDSRAVFPRDSLAEQKRCETGGRQIAEPAYSADSRSSRSSKSSIPTDSAARRRYPSGTTHISQRVPVEDELQKSEIDIILAHDDGHVVNLDGIQGRVTLAYAECGLQTPSGRCIALAEWENGWLRYWHQLLYNGSKPTVAVKQSPLRAATFPSGDGESQRWSRLTQAWMNATRE